MDRGRQPSEGSREQCPTTYPPVATCWPGDLADPLGPLRSRFRVSDPDLVYLDGNSLGRLPLATAERLRVAVEQEWGDGLIGSWGRWLDLPGRVGDELAAHLLGAEPGEVAAGRLHLGELLQARGRRAGRPTRPAGGCH